VRGPDPVVRFVVLVQLAGYVAATVGLVILFGPWALVAAGALLVVLPELVDLTRTEVRRGAAPRAIGTGDTQQH
jgi:hypothetical protein